MIIIEPTKAIKHFYQVIITYNLCHRYYTPNFIYISQTLLSFNLCTTFLTDFLLRFYLFIFRQRGREGEREGEKHQCVVASHVHQSPGLQPRHVP